jgi:hypothetical protein
MASLEAGSSSIDSNRRRHHTGPRRRQYRRWGWVLLIAIQDGGSPDLRGGRIGGYDQLRGQHGLESGDGGFGSGDGVASIVIVGSGWVLT